jgi:hypothetical protein
MTSGYELSGIKLLLTYVDAVFEEFTSKYDDMLSKGVISYDGLSFVFKKDTKAYGTYRKYVLDEKIIIIRLLQKLSIRQIFFVYRSIILF